MAATCRGDITTTATATSILLLQIVHSNAVIASAGQEVPAVHALNGQSKHPAPVYRADLTRLRELEAHSPAGCNCPLQDTGMLQPSALVAQQPKHTTVMRTHGATSDRCRAVALSRGVCAVEWAAEFTAPEWAE